MASPDTDKARIELLRGLAWARDEFKGERYSTHVPLFVGEWKSAHDSMAQAAQECAAIGEIDYNDAGHHPNGPMVRITELGYSRIRAIHLMPNHSEDEP